jgi:hypothetical protein
LVGVMREMLAARGRAEDPHQRARIGEALIALETARMWVHRAARLAGSGTGDPSVPPAFLLQSHGTRHLDAALCTTIYDHGALRCVHCWP